MNCPFGCEGGLEDLGHSWFKCGVCGEWFKIENWKQPEIKEIRKVKPGGKMGWGLVEAEMQRNTAVRVNWSNILRMSLTRAVARLKAQGFDSEGAYRELCRLNPVLSEELKRRLRIGIAARFGETATYDSEKKKVKS